MDEAFRDTSYRLAFFDDAPIPIAYVGTDGAFLDCNAAWCDLTGYAKAELERMGFQRITHPDDLDGDADMVRRCLSGESDGYSMVKRYIKKQGDTVWFTLHVRVIREVSGDVRHFISWAVPLPNHGKFKPAVDERGEVYVRPAIKIGDFITDNWATLLPWGCAILYVLYRVVERFGEVLERLELDW